MRNGFQLDTAAYQVAGELRRAQIEAIKRNQTIRVTKTAASTYDVESLTPAVTLLTAGPSSQGWSSRLGR